MFIQHLASVTQCPLCYLVTQTTDADDLMYAVQSVLCYLKALFVTWLPKLYMPIYSFSYRFSISLPNIQSVTRLPNFHVVNLGIQYRPFYPNNHIPC